MIVVNTTFHVDATLAERWLAWAEATLRPAAVSVPALTDPTLLRLMYPTPAVDDDDDDDATTFAFQVRAYSPADAARWLDVTLPPILAEMHNLWGNSVLHFSSLLEELIPQ